MHPVDKYAVIGNPIAHSKSPDIHAHFAAQTGQSISYARLLSPLEGFSATVRTFIAQGGKGANVTVPFKLDAYNMANALTDRARGAGAVNTLTFDNGAIRGDNTDGVGLVTDIVKNAGVPIAGKRVLLLGAGGAARGVILPILAQNPASLFIANRTPVRAVELATIFFPLSSATISSVVFEALGSSYDIVINATSAGLSDEMPAVPPVIFDAATLAYDMLYGALPTRFMQFAAQHGASARDGLGMLVEQAAESFFVWRGVRPDTAPVLAAMRNSL